MSANRPHLIQVEAIARYESEHSDPDEDRYLFSYQITLNNAGSVAAKLLGRHWIITDATGQVEEVTGEGVVGEQPVLSPGEGYHYSSGCALSTPFGTMRGTYRMLAEDGTEFEADIPEFFLIGPLTLH